MTESVNRNRSKVILQDFGAGVLTMQTGLYIGYPTIRLKSLCVDLIMENNEKSKPLFYFKRLALLFFRFGL